MQLQLREIKFLHQTFKVLIFNYFKQIIKKTMSQIRFIKIKFYIDFYFVLKINKENLIFIKISKII
jgi:hypothetical protein